MNPIKTKRGLEPGQKVYTINLVLEDNRTNPNPKPVPRGGVREEEFYRCIDNYLGRFGERWVIGPVGRRDQEGTAAPYWMAYLPERIYLSRESARAALVKRIDDMISQLQTLMETV
jgi:hypothetical protein